MKLLIWNVRGCNKPFKQKEIRVLLNQNKVTVAALLETRVKNDKAQKCLEKIGRGWQYINNYEFAVNGRVWVLWDPRRVYVNWVQGHEQAICCEIMDVETGRSQYFIAVYTCNTGEQRKRLWEFLKYQCDHLLAGSCDYWGGF